MPTISKTLLAAALPAALLAACAMPGGPAAPAFSQADLPAAVQVPDGHKVVMETVGVGKITYECRARKDMADQFEWVFVGPDATLMDRRQQAVGKYYGPPATWESRDGSKVTGTQVAVAPAAAGSIPMQLVKANPAMGMGAMQGVSHIQRVATRGGVAPQAPCDMARTGQKVVVDYQADYIFWTPVAMR
ncbi:hypothetical protein CDN99_13475 [Roseateles aquatilis]|uniref:DUF3455 domain-containing protein n=1 Tax=Roseateles aquatilis TaxID=431061 RepID=A0A246JDG3_9BURK|nr:DUF3455 domain-containing protein [Roseateles aquatilis]OWQ90537.1 hypothetical protein CDN99_13475 [Roseateles aquatilis]